MSRPSGRIVPAVGVGGGSDQPTDGRLARTALADQTERFAARDVETTPPTTAWTGGADRNRPVPEVNDFCRSRASKSDAGSAMLAGVVRL